MNRRIEIIVLLFLMTVGFIALCGLGAWQMKRLAWKENLIARVEKNLTNTPQSVEDIEAMLNQREDIEYRPVTVAGTFDHSKEQHYFATYKSEPGYFVYTPLKRDNGQIFFINRGFVPYQLKPQDLRKDGLVEGRVEIVGLARSAPTAKPNSFVSNNDLTKNVYYWKSISQMYGRAFDKTEISTAKFFIDANNAPHSGKLPIGGVTRIVFPNSHLQYALTWFGLAAALLAVGGIFLFGRMKASNGLQETS